MGGLYLGEIPGAPHETYNVIVRAPPHPSR